MSRLPLPRWEEVASLDAGQLSHRVLAVQECPQNAQPGGVGQQLQRGRCLVDLSWRRLLACLRSHAHSVTGAHHSSVGVTVVAQLLESAYVRAVAGHVEWVLLAYRVPREPSTPRITVWRKLKRLGVAQVVDGLVALPLDARTKEHLEWLGDEIVV